MSFMFPTKISNASMDNFAASESHLKEIDLIICMCIFCLLEELCHKQAVLLFNFADSQIP